MNAQQKMESPAQTLARLKDQGEDFEWYPTTDAMLETIKADIKASDRFGNYYRSILDVGAGNGKVLKALRKHTCYAIEKSLSHIQAMDSDIVILGTDFTEQVLLDKPVDIVFSNPPYSAYESWAVKILREACAQVVYLVIPSRWTDSVEIQAAIAARDAKVSVLDTTDFLQPDAERKARAKVDILRISFDRRGRGHDPFDLWFDSSFKISATRSSSLSEWEREQQTRDDIQSHLKRELVNGRDLIACLVEYYNQDLQQLIATYKSLEQIDGGLFAELEIHLDQLKKGLKLKIAGIKKAYWSELFERFDRITSGLTTKNRQAILDRLMENTSIDFTASNAYALAIFVLKQAAEYTDSQLVAVFMQMVSACNIQNYVSNQRTWGKEQWRYNRKPDDLSQVCLDLRIVVEGQGGLCTSEWAYDRDRHNGLEQRAYTFLSDLITIANGLGYKTDPGQLQRAQWASNKMQSFNCVDRKTGKSVDLMQVRCFKKGTIHIKFHSPFLMALNVEAGRLLGWIKNARQAVDEMPGIDPEIAVDSFNSYQCLTVPSGLQLLGMEEAA